MPISAGPKYLALSRAQQLYVGLVLLVVLPIVFALVFQSQIYDAYLEQFVRPGLEQEFGFTAGTVRLATVAGSCEHFAIVAVTPEGLLAKAGVRPGDLPVGYKHGFATGLYQSLLSVRRGSAASIRVLATSDYGKGRDAWREVRLEPPVNR